MTRRVVWHDTGVYDDGAATLTFGGVASLAKSGSSALTGAVTLSAGSNVTLTQAGQDISIASSGGGGGTQGTEIGYDQITSNVSVASSSESSGTTVISCAAHSFDGSPVLAEFFAPYVAPVTQILISLFEGSTQLARWGQFNIGNIGFPALLAMRFTPSAASHTYTVTAWQVGGTGTIGAGAGGTSVYPPAFIRFTKV
jgi:hypothetical protein